MANATNSTPGSVILAGDLTGTATSPALRPTGVTAGAHWPWYFWVDSKGRILKTSSDLSQASFLPFVPTATDSSKGIMQAGRGIHVSAGEISLAYASPSEKGIVQVTQGNGLALSTSILSFSPPDATDAIKGVVSVNSESLSSTDGVISTNIATDSTIGLVKIGTTLQIIASVLDVGGNVSKLDAVNQYTKAQTSELNIRNSVTGNVDIAPTTYSDNQLWNLTGNIVVDNSADSLLIPGAVVNVILKQDATGSRTISFGSNYLTGGGITLSTAPDTYDQLTFVVIDSTTILVLFSSDWV